MAFARCNFSCSHVTQEACGRDSLVTPQKRLRGMTSETPQKVATSSTPNTTVIFVGDDSQKPWVATVMSTVNHIFAEGDTLQGWLQKTIVRMGVYEWVEMIDNAFPHVPGSALRAGRRAGQPGKKYLRPAHMQPVPSQSAYSSQCANAAARHRLHSVN